MQQMLKLRHQLTRILNQMFEHEQDFVPVQMTPSLPPPSDSTKSFLCQVLAAGFVDQVARRIPAGTITEGSRMEKTCGYFSADASIKEPLYIHPQSSLFHPKAAKLSEFVAYQSIVRSSKSYMKNVTAIDIAWLVPISRHSPLCVFSSPLENPHPRYDRVKDQMECFVSATFGGRNWKLPIAKIPYHEHDKQKYRWFARFLVQGEISPKLKISPDAIENPSLLTRQRKKHPLVDKLEHDRIDSCQKLVAKLEQDPTYLAPFGAVQSG